MSPAIGSLFTGYGGLDMAVEAILGGTVVWTAEIDSGASKIIAHRYPDVPNHGDITAMDWATAQPITILTGGWPCQPFSHAGRRLGAADDRALWPEVARAIRILRPRYVFLENVSAITTAGELARAVASLAALGYVGSWRSVRAADVGAPHRRERLFIVATNADSERVDRVGRAWDGGGEPQDDSGQLLPTPTARDHKGHNQRRDTSCLTGALLPTPTATPYGNNQSPSAGTAVRPSLDTLAPLLPTPNAGLGEHRRDNGQDPARRRAQGRQVSTADVLCYLPTPSAADGLGGHERRGGERGEELLLAGLVKSERFGQYSAAVARWGAIIGRPAPDPTVQGRLSPAFVEWMMGLPAGWVTDVPGLTRAQQLKALGNGVVPQQAAAALAHMLQETP